MTGVLKAVSGTTLTFSDGSTANVAAGAAVSLSIGGAAEKAVKLTDLQAGDDITTSGGEPAKVVKATR